MIGTVGLIRWAPAAVFTAGAVLLHGLAPQGSYDLREPLGAVVPSSFDGYEEGIDVTVSEAEAEVAGFTDYLMRSYPSSGNAADWASIYVGYYESQTQGKTIHSPKNCLPGAGWEPLAAQVASIDASDGSLHQVNRYILQREDEQALVLYWYQGRGRVAHNEYLVKWDLLRDAALRRRSDEALVRVVIPVTTTEDAAFEKAQAIAGRLIPAVERALPE